MSARAMKSATPRGAGLTSGLVVHVVRPTKKHRLAIAPGMLGTVYGVNAAGEARFFDYDFAAAREFAGLDEGTDIRYSIPPRRNEPAWPYLPHTWVRSGALEANPSRKQHCYWVKDAS